MYDLFISHSSLDKKELVNPLVDILKANGLLIWFDVDQIPYGADVKASISNGIQNSLLYVVIITDNFFKSNWTSYELASKLEGIDAKNVMPIIIDVSLEEVSKRYPFLLNYRYLRASTNLQTIADSISSSLCEIKESQGYDQTDKTNLSLIAKKIHQYNSIKLDRIGIKIRSANRDLANDPVSALNTLNLIIESILIDIAEQENVYLDGHSDILQVIEASGVIPGNTIEQMKYLTRLRRRLISDMHAKLDHDDTYLAEISISSIVEYYTGTYFRMPLIKKASLEIIAPEDISDDDIEEMYVIEKLVLPPDLIAGPEMTRLWYDFNPLTIVGVRDTSSKKLVGFLHTLPITDELFKQIYSGSFDDTIISVNEIKQYDMPGMYKLYISSLCVHPKYNNTHAFKLLYTSFINLLLTLAEDNDVFITDVIADGATAKGASLCETIGMMKIVKSNHGTPVYHSPLLPPSLATIKLNNRQGQQLIKYYERIYQEFKELF